MGLALAFALDVGRMCGNGKCQKRGAKISPGCCAVGDHGTNLTRQPCPLFQFSLFFLVQSVQGKRSLLPVEKLNRWACQSLFFIVVKNLSRYTKGIGGNNSIHSRFSTPSLAQHPPLHPMSACPNQRQLLLWVPHHGNRGRKQL